MKQTTKIAIAGLLSAAGAVFTAFAAEFTGATPETPDPETPAPKKAAKEKKPAPAAPAEPHAGAAASEAQAEQPEPTSEGKTYEELRALIAPLVKDGQGEEVKKVIAKYDPDSNPPSLKTMPAKNHAAFEKDIAALSY